MEDPLFKPVSKSAAMKKTAWNNLADLTQNIDFISNRMSSARRQERADEINKYLALVISSPSYAKSKANPNPPLTDAIINQAIAYARTLMGESSASGSLIKDPRTEPAI